MNTSYIDQIVEAWESGYQKGLLTLWVLLAVDDQPRHARDVHQWICGDSGSGLKPDEKSIYRSLGRFRKMELVESYDQPSENGGTALKVYILTELGQQALQRFIDRNIIPVFLTDQFKRRMKGI